ncbi:MAG: hypothetical protein WC554_01920 [Clostridia bacterium]
MKTILLETSYEKNNLPEAFFSLRADAFEKLIEHKKKTGSYQKSSYSFPNKSPLGEPNAENLLTKNKKYLEILKNIKL